LNIFEFMNDSAKQYTSFWPVFIVFFFFTITAILQLISNVQAKDHLQAGVAQLSRGAQQAQAKETALSGLAHDLIDLAPTSAIAQQIVTDFRIQVKNQAPKQRAATGGAPAPGAPAANTNTVLKQ
jgi:hypothetical protein